MENENLYDILQVAPTATVSEIEAAYQRKCSECHPDRAQSEDEVQQRTLLMFKINSAKEILLDKKKRREFDEALRRGDSGDPTYQDDDDDDKKEAEEAFRPPQQAPKNRQTGNLGIPYDGPMDPISFYFDGNGRKGEDATDGGNGSNGNDVGMSGGRGGEAGPAGQGYPADDLKIQMNTDVSEDGYFAVFVNAVKGTEVMDPQRDHRGSVPLKVFNGVDWTARGGNGGNGGRGGNGGDGYRGKNDDDDAVRLPVEQKGTNGGTGGDGGDGGAGSDGGNGGRGGDVEIALDRCDTYLLMRVAGCEPQEGLGSRLDGGEGGAAGTHGIGGNGGAGGKGGSSVRNITQKLVKRGDEDNNATVHQTIPGGRSGSSGSGGGTPTCTLNAGTRGRDGTFFIRVRSSSAPDCLYESRYSLSFVSTTTKSLSKMKSSPNDMNKTYQFGETVIVDSCVVKNTGSMETPSQRVVIGFDQVKNVEINYQDRIFLDYDSYIAPGNQGIANQGYLRFTCSYPSTTNLGTDFDPIYQDGLIKYNAYQLGPENHSQNPSTISDFQEEYKNFHESTGEVFHMAFPIENGDGIRGLHSLAAQETTLVELTLSNTSKQNFGDQPATGRAVFVQFYYGDDQEYDIPLDKVEVRGAEGTLVNIDPTSSPKGHRSNIAFLPGSGETTLRLSLKFTDARPCERVALQADVYMQNIPTLLPDGSTEGDTTESLIQRRIFTVSCQPIFRHDKISDVVFVTTESNNSGQVRAWLSLVEDRLRLQSQIYSLSRYGHLNAMEVVDNVDGASLMEVFKNKLVVVLNELYVPQPNQARTTYCRPSQMMNSAFDFDSSTRFLLVGGGVDDVHHLSPKATGVLTVISHADDAQDNANAELSKPNRKSYQRDLLEILRNERNVGFSSERVEPSCTTVTIKTQTILRPHSQKIERILQNRANSLRKWLRQQDALRPYTVEWAQLGAPQRLKSNCLFSSWKIGELRVYTGPPRFQNSTFFVGDMANSGDTTALSSQLSIQSRFMLNAVVTATRLETKVGCYCRSLRALAASEPESIASHNHQEVCDVVSDCLIADFLRDVSDYVDGRMETGNATDRSQTLQHLMSSESISELLNDSLHDEELHKTVIENFSRLLAGLRCVAESKDLSKKQSVCKAVREPVTLLEERWKCVLNEEKIAANQKIIEQKATSYIKKHHKEMHLQTNGHWMAALNVIYSPENKERYPRSPGSDSVRLLRQAELCNGNSNKKLTPIIPETVSPSDAATMRENLKQRQEFSQSTLWSVQDDVTDYRQHD